MSPSERRLRSFVERFFTTWDEDWARYMGDAIRDFALDLRIPPLATEEQLRSLRTPTLVIAAGKDISFPGGKLLDHVKRFMPNVETELIKGSRHSPPTTDEFRRWLAERMTRFFNASVPA